MEFFFHFGPSPGRPERTGGFCFSLLSRLSHRLSHVPWLCDCLEGMRKEKKNKNQIKTVVMVTRRQVFKQQKRKRAKKSPQAASADRPELLAFCHAPQRKSRSKFLTGKSFESSPPNNEYSAIRKDKYGMLLLEGYCGYEYYSHSASTARRDVWKLVCAEGSKTETATFFFSF